MREKKDKTTKTTFSHNNSDYLTVFLVTKKQQGVTMDKKKLPGFRNPSGFFVVIHRCISSRISPDL